MLRELKIKNFAIADEVRIEFEPGLNVITGETGAGKSVIIRALGLLCGGRATGDMIRADEESASIEGLFSLPGCEPLLEPAGVEDAAEVLVRRIVQRNGKAKAQVNGSPVTVALLNQLAAHAILVYGQHDQTVLLQPESHLQLLDRYGVQRELRERMSAAFGQLDEARRRLDELTRGRERLVQRRELLEFQAQELVGAGLRAGEEAELRREREVARHAEKLHQFCSGAESALYSGDGALTDAVARLAAQLRELTRIDPALGEPLQGLESAGAELEAAARALGAYAERVHFDPERLEEIEQRLTVLSRLSRKYECPSAELPALLEKIRADLANLAGDELDLDRLREEVSAREAAALETARALSAARIEAAGRLQKEVERELATLGMKGSVFQVRVASRPAAAHLAATGCDTVEFFLSANPGNPPLPLAEVASGGELSRVMLAIEALTASVSDTPILVFDEVDAGIGGSVADAVGRCLKRLASTRQLLCITHLPQIAAYADHHLAVEKSTSRGRTITRTRPLRGDERIAEISRMLGGSVAPAEAARYARKLLAEARGVMLNA